MAAEREPLALVPILVVDDNFAKRLALKAALSPLGYRVVEADSGVSALRCLLAENFAVILLDVLMPVMDGFETAAFIRQREESEMTPIIFITAYRGDEIGKRNRYAEGAVDFILAPVAPAELRAKVSVFANIFVRAQAFALQAQEVQASSDQLRLLTDAAPIGIFRTDAENRYLYTNPRWSAITGMPAAVAMGQRWDAIIDADKRAAFEAELVADAAGQGELSHRFEVRHADLGQRVLHVTSKSIIDRNGVVAGWVGTLADVTTEVRAEAALSGACDAATEDSRLKTDFLANMSHEIRTPMNGVIGMTDLLLETDLDPQQRDYAQTVRNSGEALITIIDNILDYSKVEAGMLEIEDIEFDVRAIVGDVVDLLASTAQAKGLELVAVVDHALASMVCGDPGRVRQVLTNLIGNAIKFTQSGEIVVRVGAPEIVGGETLIRFEVADTGDGMSPDKLDRIFQPFVQGDTSISRKYGGTGLGLTISAQLVALMRGESGVTSQLGKGSTFWFTIRVRAAGTNTLTDRPSLDVELAGLHVLIVDDNAAQRDVLSEMLNDLGMIVATSDRGVAALESMRDAGDDGRPYAAVLIDQSMPGMDGLQLKSAIVDDPTLTARLILMTGLAHRSDLDTSELSGIAATLTKPVHRENLRSCLRIALELDVVDVAARVTSSRRSRATPEPGHVLLAEDNLINQKVAVAILSKAGYRVDTVLNGAAAVRAAALERYDTILMDCHMPELNGYEATAAIRAQESPGQHTPIIAMTAGARWEDRARCLAEGMDGYLAKPISKDSLLSLVARFVEMGKASRAPSPHILLVEDNPVNQQVGLAMLDVLGYQVDVVADGASAVEAALLTPYHAILMDCHIPVLDGFEATREIRLLEGDAAHTPIIAVTASAMESDHQGCIASGMDDYLTKPLTLKALAATLARWAPGGSLPAVLEDLDEGARQPAVDPQIVDRLVQLGMMAGEDLVEKLTGLFVTEANSRVAELRRGLAARDLDALWRAAHALSGSSATLGATCLSGLCATLASDCAAGDLAAGEAQLDAVDNELGRVLTALGANAIP